MVSILDNLQLVRVQLQDFATACSPEAATSVFAANGTQVAAYAGIPATVDVPMEAIQAVIVEIRGAVLAQQ